MNEKKAYLSEFLDKYKGIGYEEFVSWINEGRIEHFEHTHHDFGYVQIEILATWDEYVGGNIRLMANLDSTSDKKKWWQIFPSSAVTCDEIIYKPDSA